jgi:hypothetical protein
MARGPARKTPARSRALLASMDLASLFIGSDMMEMSVVSEVQFMNRIEAFLEGPAARRRQAEAA